LGGYISIRDMFDGGGRGGPGPTFQGGIMSGALNAAGISPYGQGSGAVSGFMERMGSGGAGPGPGMYGSSSIGGDNTAGALAPAPVAMPAPEMPMAPVDEAGPAQMLPPGYQMAGLGDVSVNPESMFTFEEYLASLNRAPGVIPPSPMGMGPVPQFASNAMGQGIGSFAPQPVQLMNMGGAVSAPMPQMFEDPMMRLGPRLPPVGFMG
jgi:hypothetical protein